MYLTPSEMNVSSWTGLLLWSNVVTDGYFGVLILLTIFLIAFITFLFVDYPEKAFAYASFIAAIMSILFLGIGILNEVFMFVCLVMAAIGIIIVKKG